MSRVVSVSGTPLAPSRSAASDRLTRRGVNQPAAATRSRPDADGKRRRDGALARALTLAAARRGLIDARWSLALHKCRSEPRASTRGSDESVAGHRQTARALAFAHLTPPVFAFVYEFRGTENCSEHANDKYDYIAWGLGMAVPDKAIGSACACRTYVSCRCFRHPKPLVTFFNRHHHHHLSLRDKSLAREKSKSVAAGDTGSKVLDDTTQLRHDPRSRTRAGAERPRRRGCCATVLH